MQLPTLLAAGLHASMHAFTQVAELIALRWPSVCLQRVRNRNRLCAWCTQVIPCSAACSAQSPVCAVSGQTHAALALYELTRQCLQSHSSMQSALQSALAVRGQPSKFTERKCSTWMGWSLLLCPSHSSCCDGLCISALLAPPASVAAMLIAWLSRVAESYSRLYLEAHQLMSASSPAFCVQRSMRTTPTCLHATLQAHLL